MKIRLAPLTLQALLLVASPMASFSQGTMQAGSYASIGSASEQPSYGAFSCIFPPILGR